MPSTASYRLCRDKQERFEEINKYFRAKATSPDAKLCHALHEAANTARKEAGWKPRPGNPYDGLPWLTLVLGSGALAVPDDARATADAIAHKVMTIAEGKTIPLGDVRLTSADLGDFTRALVRDRMGLPDSGTPSADEVSVTVAEVAVDLLLCAYFSTRLYYDIQALDPLPLGRWDDDIAHLRADADPEDVGKVLDLVTVTTALLREARERLLGDGEADLHPRAREAVVALIDEIRNVLDREHVLRVDALRLLTDVAWIALAGKTALYPYPGWTDLLVTLTLREGEREFRRFRRARPRPTNLCDLADTVREAYARASVDSWRAIMTSDGTAAHSDPSVQRRSALYGAAAEVLWAQTDAATTTQGTTHATPPPVAFVTSFDIELDMALWRTAGDRLIRVALPVHAADGPHAEEAEFCWLVADIWPTSRGSVNERYSTLLAPTNWRLLTPDFIVDELSEAPTIVHLSGCPLFTLPSRKRERDAGDVDRLVDSLRKVGVVLDRDQVTFQPAVTIDEYLALRQSEVELIWFGAVPGKSGTRLSRALPAALVENRLGNPRFWMSMGVPIGDPAVRHRFVTQLTRQRIIEMAGPDAEATSAAMMGSDPYADPPHPAAEGDRLTRNSRVDGVAVNARIGDDETSLLYWVGLDVVSSDCNEFADELAHYAKHVRQPDERPHTSKRCPIDVEEDSR
jgi:hypothetical protein